MLSSKELFLKQKAGDQMLSSRLLEIVDSDWFQEAIVYAMNAMTETHTVSTTELNAIRKFIDVLSDLPQREPESKFPKPGIDHHIDRPDPNLAPKKGKQAK